MKTYIRFLTFLLILALTLSTTALATEDESVRIIDAWPDSTGIYFLTDNGNGTVVYCSIGRPMSHGSSILARNVVSVVKDGGTIPMLIRSDGSITAYDDYNKYDLPYEFDSEEWNDLVLMGASETHAVGLKRDGTWISAGEYRNGECDVEEWTDIVQLQVGRNYTVGLKADGTVVMTGKTWRGDKIGRDLSQWTDIVKIDVSDDFVDHYSVILGLKSDGTVVATDGEKNKDQTFVGRWKNVIDICSGEEISLGITKEGEVLSTGHISYMPKDYKCENAIGIMCTYGGYGPVLVIKADNTFEALGDSADIYNKYLNDAESLLKDVGKDPSKSKKADSPKSLTSSECEQIALNYLKNMLKNPDSLQVHSNSATKSGDSYVVKIDYSAMNGFGGYNRETFVCTVDKDGKVSGAFSY